MQRGSKFFVAKVDAEKVTVEEGRATLSPLRFHYDADEFSLPVRLGLINSPGTQDLIVHVLAQGKRYRVANYPNAVIPTNLDVTPATKERFGEFYAALFDEVLGPRGDAVVTEYAWSAGGCDPCPDRPLGVAELVTLGADVLPNVPTVVERPRRPPLVRMSRPSVQGRLPPEVIQRILRQNFGRLRLCFESARRRKPKLAGTVTAKVVIGAAGEITAVTVTGERGFDTAMTSCVKGALQGLSFPRPEGGGIVTFSAPIEFGLDPEEPASPPRRVIPWGFAAGFVLTRLHARYGEGALGADLVFEEAPAIEGGRELWAGGKLEKGAREAKENNFQARYAIRHPWEGAIECDGPRRGVWGGPPRGAADLGASRPVAARDVAFAKRGEATLATFLKQELPPIDRTAPTKPTPIASAAADPSSPAPSSRGGGGCGCVVAGSPTRGWALAWTVCAALALRRRLASRSRCAGRSRPRPQT